MFCVLSILNQFHFKSIFYKLLNYNIMPTHKSSDYKCSKRSDFNKHILTRKHQRTYNGLTNADKNSPKIAKFECDC